MEIKVSESVNVILIRVCGKITYSNYLPLNFYLDKIQNTFKKVEFDFIGCNRVDSTVVGTLARFGLEYGKRNKGRTFLVAQGGVLEIFSTLGIDRIFVLIEQTSVQSKKFQVLTPRASLGTREEFMNMLKAHEELMRLSKKNEKKFRPVVEVLKQELKEKK